MQRLRTDRADESLSAFRLAMPCTHRVRARLRTDRADESLITQVRFRATFGELDPAFDACQNLAKQNWRHCDSSCSRWDHTRARAPRGLHAWRKFTKSRARGPRGI